MFARYPKRFIKNIQVNLTWIIKLDMYISLINNFYIKSITQIQRLYDNLK